MSVIQRSSAPAACIMHCRRCRLYPPSVPLHPRKVGNVKRQQTRYQPKGANMAVAGGDGGSQHRILSMPLSQAQRAGGTMQRYNRQSQPRGADTARADTAAVAAGIPPLLSKIEGHQFDTQV